MAVETVRPSTTLKVWRRITYKRLNIATYAHALVENRVDLRHGALELLTSLHPAHLPTEEVTLRLVRLKIGDSRLVTSGAPTPEELDRQLGFNLLCTSCPAWVGPQLRLDTLHEKEGDSLWVVSHGTNVMGWSGKERGFWLLSSDDRTSTQVLDGMPIPRNVSLSPDHEIVVAAIER